MSLVKFTVRGVEVDVKRIAAASIEKDNTGYTVNVEIDGENYPFITKDTFSAAYEIADAIEKLAKGV